MIATIIENQYALPRTESIDKNKHRETEPHC